MDDRRLLLALTDVRAGYREAVAGPVSFAVHAGEVLGLAGPNGAGKTTLLRAISGTARLFGGAIERAAGLRLSHHRQTPARPPELPLTGREMLRLSAVPAADLPERLRRIEHLCLEEMSGGQYQFLHAWCCLKGNADLVLLDEPTNNLDREGIQLLTDELHTLSARRAVLVVSHERDFLEAVCHRMIPF